MKVKPNHAWAVGEIAYVDVSTPTHPRTVALIDASDLGLVNDGGGRWHAWQARTSRTLYVVRWGPRPMREQAFLHRAVLGLRKGDGALVDHANWDGLDNRRSNLRLATFTQNAANVPRLSDHMRGVRARYGRWHAQVNAAGRQRFLGSFPTEEDAARAYDAAARELFGAFALVNFPEEQTA